MPSGLKYASDWKVLPLHLLRSKNRPRNDFMQVMLSTDSLDSKEGKLIEIKSLNFPMPLRLKYG